MSIRRGTSIVLSLMALGGSSPSAGAQDSARAAAAVPAGVGEEMIPLNEGDVIEELQALQLKLMTNRATDGKPTERGQHPKTHGFVVAKFTVREDLPEELRVGFLREPRSYTAVIRFSNTREEQDGVRDNHGMAIKLLGVEGEKLLDGEKDAQTQDFVLIDHPLFFARDVESTLALSLAGIALEVALEQDKDQKKRLDALPVEQARQERLDALARLRPEEAKLLGVRRRIITSPLATEYFSDTPYRLGKTAVKYSAKPERSEAAGSSAMDGKDYLREAMVEQLTVRRRPATFGFYVQRQGDPKAMPIEDPTVAWTSDWERVATIEIGAQDFDFPERVAWGNALSYTPWHALKEHRPLGGINRARKMVYPDSSRLRHFYLGAPRKEPTEADIPMKNGDGRAGVGPAPPGPSRPGTPGSGDGPGLDRRQRQDFYHRAEGSEVYPLAWLKALETKDGPLFFDDLGRFGLIEDPDHPEHLPIGMTAEIPPDIQVFGPMIGFNCAACHVGELTRGGRSVRIDGAPNLFDINAFYRELIEATVATILDPGKLGAFRDRLPRQDDLAVRRAGLFVVATLASLEPGQVEKLMEPERSIVIDLGTLLKHAEDGVRSRLRSQGRGIPRQEALRELLARSIDDQEVKSLWDSLGRHGSGGLLDDLKARDVEELKQGVADAGLLKARIDYLRNLINLHTEHQPTLPGPGRIDPCINGRNLIFPDEGIASDSPVSYPHLWQVNQTAWFHWDGDTNSFLERNIGQAVGTGAAFRPDLVSLVQPGNLHELEGLARRIPPPRWPAEVMGQGVDRAKALRGEAIFKERCIICHRILASPEDKAPDIFVSTRMIETDPNRADNFARKLRDGREFAAQLGETTNGIKKRWYEDRGIPLQDQKRMDLPDDQIQWRTTRGYVARPLVAIRATPPYLHNGSVPTLHDLLLPAAWRPRTFPVGQREYDPVKLGYVTDEARIPPDQLYDLDPQAAGRQDFDTTRPGNHNSGHEGHAYGTDLPERQRMDLLEYLKGT
jgi:hypothetical protein